jgi:membrane-associated phospholipid phosphatase
MILFGLRQICQALCALPPPEGMIWRSPGVPSLLVTYGVANDLFFSGHTALAVYGAIELGRWGGPVWAVAGALLAVFEAAVVLVLRAHYTMDVFTGVVTAFAAVAAADCLAPGCDAALIRLGTILIGN